MQALGSRDWRTLFPVSDYVSSRLLEEAQGLWLALPTRADSYQGYRMLETETGDCNVAHM
jgi:hypothetical protein